jgi:hypothetical protein
VISPFQLSVSRMVGLPGSFSDKFLRANKINALSPRWHISAVCARWVKLIKLYHLFYILLVIEHKTGCCVCKLAGSIYYHVAIIKAALRAVLS